MELPAGQTDLLDSRERAILLAVARESLEAYVRSRIRIALCDDHYAGALREPRAAFVTLRTGTALRGCIGRTVHDAPLAESVRDSAVNAAAHDPRFPPVHPGELETIRIEISALGDGADPSAPYIPIQSPEEIRIGRDGLLIRSVDGTGGILLPQVALSRAWDATQFLDAVCQKAGLPPGAWRDPGLKLYRFTAQTFAEEGYLEP